MAFFLLLIVCGVFAMWSSGLFVWRRLHAGHVVLRVQPSRSYIAIDLVTSAGLILLAGWWSETWNHIEHGIPFPYLAFLALAWVCLAVRQIAQPHSLLQMYEHGLFVRPNGFTLATYIPWDCLGSFAFSDGETLTMQYRAWRTSAGFPSDLTVRCPRQQRDRVAQLLTEHRPGWLAVS